MALGLALFLGDMRRRQRHHRRDAVHRRRHRMVLAGTCSRRRSTSRRVPSRRARGPRGRPRPVADTAPPCGPDEATRRRPPVEAPAPVAPPTQPAPHDRIPPPPPVGHRRGQSSGGAGPRSRRAAAGPGGLGPRVRGDEAAARVVGGDEADDGVGEGPGLDAWNAGSVRSASSAGFEMNAASDSTAGTPAERRRMP